MTVRFSRRSLNHLRDIRDHVARERPDIAELVRLRILATVKRLQHAPRLGHAGRASGTRELLVPGLPFVIVYRIDSKDELVILAIFHTARER
jgi:toxin ParE1/3/4